MHSVLWVSVLSLETPTMLLSKHSLYEWWVNKDLVEFSATPVENQRHAAGSVSQRYD